MSRIVVLSYIPLKVDDKHAVKNAIFSDPVDIHGIKNRF